MALADFPGELVSRVFSHIPNDHLYECMKVCKLWHRQISIDIYQNISLIQYHVRFLERTQMIHADGTQIGEYVHTLTFQPKNMPTGQKLTQQEFALLLSNLPHLQVIRFLPFFDSQTIVDYLIYFKIIARYTNIQEIHIPDLNYSNKKIRKIRRFHYMANYILHDKITKFTLHDLDIRTIVYNETKLLKQLSKYKNLQHLSLFSTASKGRYYFSYRRLHVASILNACPNLESLQLVSYLPWTETVSQRTYPQLTKLSLSIASLDKSNIKYLMQYVPNLKRLSIRMHSVASLSELYNTLPSNTATKFISYLKQLDYLNIESSSKNKVQDTTLFWNLMRNIYDDTFRCNLHVSIYSPQIYNEHVTFDRARKTFNIYYEWILHHDLEPDWTRHIDFLKFASLNIENRDRMHKEPLLKELMHPGLLAQQPFLSIMNNGARIILDEKTTTMVYGNKDVYDRPKIKCAYLSYLKPEQGVLDTIGTYNPGIQYVTMVNCDLPKQGDYYLLDLSQFKDVYRLEFDFDLIFKNSLEKIPGICLQITSEGKKTSYLLDQQKQWKSKGLEDGEIIKGAVIIKINSVKLRQVVFKRDRKEVFATE